MRLLAATGLACSLLFHAVAVRALTVAECERWMAQLGGETATLPIVRTERDALLGHLDDASRKDRQPTLDDTLESVTKFQEQAAALARDGKVSRTEGERLKNLSEAVRRCLQQAGPSK